MSSVYVGAETSAARETATGKIYYFCPDLNFPSGGIRKLYDHVDLLNSRGFTASILHQKPGFRVDWYSNNTRVSYLPQTQLSPSDVLLLPEGCGPGMSLLAPGVRKVVFNQNCYYTFAGYGFDPQATVTPYVNPEFVAVIVVSDDSRQYLQYAFPNLRIFRLHIGMNAQRFAYQGQKRRQICFMPRRHAEDAEQVVSILKFRGMLRDFSVVPIHNMSDQQVVQTLQESLLFLSFGFPEGWPSPPAEAMMCGCVVVGYHGWGGREYFNPDYCYPVEPGDVIGFARTVERVIQECARDPGTVLRKGALAAQYITTNHTPQREEAEVLGFWTELMGRR
jgi:hypothetical protein